MPTGLRPSGYSLQGGAYPSGAPLTQDDQIRLLLQKAGWSRMEGPSAAIWNPRVNRAPLVKMGNFYYQGPMGKSAMDLQSVLGPLKQGEIGFSPMDDSAAKSVGERAKEFKDEQINDEMYRDLKRMQLIQALSSNQRIDPLSLALLDRRKL